MWWSPSNGDSSYRNSRTNTSNSSKRRDWAPSIRMLFNKRFLCSISSKWLWSSSFLPQNSVVLLQNHSIRSRNGHRRVSSTIARWIVTSLRTNENWFNRCNRFTSERSRRSCFYSNQILDFISLKTKPGSTRIPYNFSIYTIYSDFIGNLILFHFY